MFEGPIKSSLVYVYDSFIPYYSYLTNSGALMLVWGQMYLNNAFYLGVLEQHNIIQIHNNVMWDSQYYAEYVPHLVWMWGIYYRIMSIPHNTVMDMNNVMKDT